MPPNAGSKRWQFEGLNSLDGLVPRRGRMRAGKPRALVIQIGVEVARDAVEVGQEAGVIAGGLQLSLVDATQQECGVVSGRFPEVAVQTPEQLDRRMIPAPPQVVGQVTQWLERGRQRRRNVERLDRPHGPGSKSKRAISASVSPNLVTMAARTSRPSSAVACVGSPITPLAPKSLASQATRAGLPKPT